MLKESLRGKVVFVGVGNPMKGDDGFGPLMAGKTGGIDAGCAPENFISKIAKEKPDTVVLFDALDFGGVPGEVKIIDAKDAEGILLSTHALPLSLLARMLFPSRVVIAGVQPAGAGFGEEMSKEVLQSAKTLAREVSEWLKRK